MGEGIFPCIIARARAVVLGGEGRLLLLLLAPALGPVAQHYSFDFDAHVLTAHRTRPFQNGLWFFAVLMSHTVSPPPPPLTNPAATGNGAVEEASSASGLS